MFGSLGPWLGVRFSADEGGRQGHGWLVLLAAVVGAVSLVVWWQRRIAGAAALLAGLVGLEQRFTPPRISTASCPHIRRWS
jgi:hypothetical protein